MKTAIITGGAGGMGLATAKILGQTHHLVLSDLNKDRLDKAVKELSSLGISSETVVCDISNRTSVNSMFSKANKTGELRAVVHTAGVSPQMGDAKFIATINVLGTINVVESALSLAKADFAVVNVASFAGHTGFNPLVSKRRNRLAFSNPAKLVQKLASAANLGPRSLRSGLAYSLSKQFVIWYSQQMAAKFGAKDARILSVSPGSFDTAMGQLEKKSGSDRLLFAAALKRFGKPEEIGELLSFCASEKAGYLTGIDILIDGGTTAGMTPALMLKMARG